MSHFWLQAHHSHADENLRTHSLSKVYSDEVKLVRGHATLKPICFQQFLSHSILFTQTCSTFAKNNAMGLRRVSACMCTGVLVHLHNTLEKFTYTQSISILILSSHFLWIETLNVIQLVTKLWQQFKNSWIEIGRHTHTTFVLILKVNYKSCQM